MAAKDMYVSGHSGAIQNYAFKSLQCYHGPAALHVTSMLLFCYVYPNKDILDALIPIGFLKENGNADSSYDCDNGHCRDMSLARIKISWLQLNRVTYHLANNAS